MRDVIISGIGMTRFGKFLDRNMKSLSEEAVSLTLRDAGITPDQVDQVIFGNAAAGVVTGQEMIRAQSSLRNTGLDGKPMFNVENACASSSTGFHLGWLMVASGHAECVLVIGCEKLTHEDKAVSFGAFTRAVDIEEPLPEGYKAGSGSLFMDLYAAKARKWIEATGGGAEDLARVVVKSRHAGSLNPLAQFRVETSLDEVMSSRMISDPLTLFMCSSIGDGAAGILLTSADFAARLATPKVRVRASAVVSAKAHEPKELVAVSAHSSLIVVGPCPSLRDVPWLEMIEIARYTDTSLTAPPVEIGAPPSPREGRAG